MSAAVRAEAEGDVLVVTIDRPEARNAVNLAVAEGIAAALDRLDGEDGLRAGVLTGAGGTFCAGMDLKAFVAGERPHVEGRGFAGIVQGPPRKPLIAAVEGWALAGGFEVALACDLIVAARDARFGIPEVKRGLVAAGGALIRLPRRIPYHLAMELALTGDPIGAERAADLGIVSRLAEPGEALPAALELARDDRRQRPAGGRRHQAHLLVADEGDAWERQAEIVAPGVRVRGRPRGLGRVRREAPAGLARDASPRRTASRPASARRRGRGARTGRRPARCRARSGRRATGSDSDGPSSDALMCAGMSSGPSTVCVQYGASSGTASSNHAAKSSRTSGEAFSFSVSDADVWRMNRCARPTRSSRSSGTPDSTSPVTRWKPRGRGRRRDLPLDPHRQG